MVEAPGVDDTFLGARVSWKYTHAFGAVATYGNDLVIDDNLSDTSDLRADMVNSLAVSVNSRLALKLSLQGVAFLPCHLEGAEAPSGRISKAA